MLKLVTVVLDVFLQDLVLKFINLILSPKQGNIAKVDNLEVVMPKGLLSLKELVKYEGSQHQILRIVVLLEYLWMLLDNVRYWGTHHGCLSDD